MRKASCAGWTDIVLVSGLAARAMEGRRLLYVCVHGRVVAVLDSDSRLLPCMQHAAFPLKTQPLPARSKARTNTWNKLDSLTGCALAPDEFPNASEPLQFHSVKPLADLRLTTVQSLIDLSSMCAWTLGGSAG